MGVAPPRPPKIFTVRQMQLVEQPMGGINTTPRHVPPPKTSCRTGFVSYSQCGTQCCTVCARSPSLVAHNAAVAPCVQKWSDAMSLPQLDELDRWHLKKQCNQHLACVDTALMRTGHLYAHASQNQGIRQHTQHTVGPIEKRTAETRGAKIDGTNAWCCLDKAGGGGSTSTSNSTGESRQVACCRNPCAAALGCPHGSHVHT